MRQRRGSEGTSTIEYALLVAGITAVIVTTVTTGLGTQLQDIFAGFTSEFSQSQATVNGSDGGAGGNGGTGGGATGGTSSSSSVSASSSPAAPSSPAATPSPSATPSPTP